MRRRSLLLGLGVAGIAVSGCLGAAAVFRPQSGPRRVPWLTDDHLARLAPETLPRPRVLFVGNSFTLNHDVPALVAAEAAKEGVRLSVAMAAAHGARLIETWRISALHDHLRPGLWDAVVLQSFSTAALRWPDRLGAAFAIRRMAAAVRPTPVVLFSPMPALAGNRVYSDAGLFAAVPGDPADLARRTTAFLVEVAGADGIHLAPVAERWAAVATPGFYAEDGHHASAEGAAFIAGVLWPALRDVLG